MNEKYFVFYTERKLVIYTYIGYEGLIELSRLLNQIMYIDLYRISKNQFTNIKRGTYSAGNEIHFIPYVPTLAVNNCFLFRIFDTFLAKNTPPCIWNNRVRYTVYTYCMFIYTKYVIIKIITRGNRGRAR